MVPSLRRSDITAQTFKYNKYLAVYIMIGSDKKIVPVTLPREDVERIEKLGKPISEFCRDAVHERLRIIEMAKDIQVAEWMYSDSEAEPVMGQDVYREEAKPDWSKLFAKT